MPPAPHEYFGRGAIAGFLWASAAHRRGERFELRPAAVNRQPAFRIERGGAPAGMLALTLSGSRISSLTRFPHLAAG